jgi:hypothetical protein
LHKNLDPYANQAKSSRNFLAVGIALFVVAVLAGLLGSGILGLGQGRGSAVTTNIALGGRVMLPAPSDKPNTILESGTQGNVFTGKTKKVMPQEILDWLKHLEATEKRRVDLTMNEQATLLSQLTMLNGVGSTEGFVQGLLRDGEDFDQQSPAREIQGQGEEHKKEWLGLHTFFDSKQPPAECVPIRNVYTQCLGETQAMYTEVSEILQSVGDDPKGAVAKLMKMQGKSTDRIDVPGRQTDKLVQEICDKYDTSKWFEVKADIGGGMGGFLGGLGKAMGR